MRKSGFSLVELLVVFAVTAMLIGLSMYGISIVTSNSRNTKRVETLTKIKSEIENYKIKYGTYPTGSQLTYNNLEFSLCNATGGQCELITVSESYLIPTEAVEDSTNKNTAYCYMYLSAKPVDSVDRRRYVLGYKNEKGLWTDVGNASSLSCGELEAAGWLNESSLEI